MPVRVISYGRQGKTDRKVNYFLSADYSGTALKAEKAVNLSSYIFGSLAASGLLLLIGRWGILRKAGKKGWYSLIPLLNAYEEYATVWNGWLGVLADLCIPVGMFFNLLKLPSIIYYILILVSFLISIPESLKLAKAFGKGKVFSALMVIPGFKALLRIFLGVGRAEFRPEANETAA